MTAGSNESTPQTPNGSGLATRCRTGIVRRHARARCPAVIAERRIACRFARWRALGIRPVSGLGPLLVSRLIFAAFISHDTVAGIGHHRSSRLCAYRDALRPRAQKVPAHRGSWTDQVRTSCTPALACSRWTCRTVVTVATATETPNATMSERSARRGAITNLLFDIGEPTRPMILDRSPSVREPTHAALRNGRATRDLAAGSCAGRAELPHPANPARSPGPSRHRPCANSACMRVVPAPARQAAGSSRRSL